jgi:hypothetical protein
MFGGATCIAANDLSRGRFWSGEAEGGHLGECKGHRPVRDGRQVVEALLRFVQVGGAEHHPQAAYAFIDPTPWKTPASVMGPSQAAAARRDWSPTGWWIVPSARIAGALLQRRSSTMSVRP